MFFESRSYKKEFLDRDDIPSDDIRRNMQELDFINTYLGGHVITIQGIKAMLALPSLPARDGLVICEIGCGGGDNLFAVSKWLAKRHIHATYIGIDKNPFCVDIAEARLQGLKARLIRSDYRTVELGERKPDIIFSSLFCHHFTNEEIITMLQWMRDNSGAGFFINDLHRHALAYFSIKLLTAIFSGSYLVKNDAPLSVLRGFRKKDWEYLFKSAAIQKYAINWKWAFRHLIVVKK